MELKACRNEEFGCFDLSLSYVSIITRSVFSEVMLTGSSHTSSEKKFNAKVPCEVDSLTKLKKAGEQDSSSHIGMQFIVEELEDDLLMRFSSPAGVTRRERY